MDDDKKKVVEVGVPPTEMRKALGAMHKDVQTIIEYQPIAAKIMRSKYLALIAEGFTEDQALKLCQL